MTPEERYARVNRLLFLASRLSDPEMDGLMVLAEVALADPRALVGMSRETAAEALAYALPHGMF